MDIWETIPKITTPFALIAFLATIILFIYKSKWRSKEKIIEGVNESQKLQAINTILRDFSNIDTAELTKKQKYELTQELIAQKIQRFKISAFISVVIAVILATVILIVNWNSKTSNSAIKEIPSLEASLAANFQAEDYGNAERNADKILDIDPHNKRALTVKGAIAYMNEDYQTTLKYYTKALQSDTNNSVIIGNLAWVYTDLGATDLALKLLSKIQDGKPDWFERMARAHLYDNNFKEALNYLKTIPNTYHKGVARIQEAACLIMIGNNQSDSSSILAFRKNAEMKLVQGVSEDEEFWKAILTEKRKDPKWPMKREIELLKPILTETVL
jgi:tetratricopeptide (TPR) repeat protein